MPAMTKGRSGSSLQSLVRLLKRLPERIRPQLGVSQDGRCSGHPAQIAREVRPEHGEHFLMQPVELEHRSVRVVSLAEHRRYRMLLPGVIDALLKLGGGDGCPVNGPRPVAHASHEIIG